MRKETCYNNNLPPEEVGYITALICYIPKVEALEKENSEMKDFIRRIPEMITDSNILDILSEAKGFL